MKNIFHSSQLKEPAALITIGAILLLAAGFFVQFTFFEDTEGNTQSSSNAAAMNLSGYLQSDSIPGATINDQQRVSGGNTGMLTVH